MDGIVAQIGGRENMREQKNQGFSRPNKKRIRGQWKENALEKTYC